MTSEGLGEMFEGDSADMCAGKFLPVSMGGLAEGLACADLGARTPIGASGNLRFYHEIVFFFSTIASDLGNFLFFLCIGISLFALVSFLGFVSV
jgi:hypothetical protein